MNKSFKKILSIVLSVMMISSLMTVSLSVSAVEDGKVRVIVRNDTYSVENGAPWDGVLVDEWVSINNDTTMMSAVADALNNHGYTQEGAENNYISSINGLAAFDGGTMSGWMGTLNDWFTNSGYASYTVADGTLESGDEIAIMYTSNGYGEDIGGTWANNDTTVKSVEITGAELSGEFDPSVTDYTLTIDTPSADVNVVPTATNKNFQTRKYKNEYLPSDDSAFYKRSQTVSVSDCALTVDMIRQTTERLCAYDILIACIGKFNHLGCQQPTLAHFTAVADNTVYKLLCVSISVWRNKAVLFSRINHKSLKLCEVVKKHRTEFVFNSASSEHLIVLNTVINLK